MKYTFSKLSFVLFFFIVLFLFASCGDSSVVSVDTKTLTDSRDGLTYKVVVIGSQSWMAENLNYETMNSYCFDDDASNCLKYGRLYTWPEAMKACPTGWHLPTKAEFETLFNSVGGLSVAGKKLKSISGWDKGGNGEDTYSFAAFPGGRRESSEYYYGDGFYASFWTSTEGASNFAYSVYFGYNYNEAFVSSDYEGTGYSVRCISD